MDKRVTAPERVRIATALGLLAAAGALLASGYIAEARAQARGQELPEITRQILRGAPAPMPPMVHAPVQTAGLSLPQRVLESRIQQLGRAFNGDVGIAMRDVRTGWTTAYDGNTLFPQQSVSKFWVALTALDRADRGMLDMAKSVTLTRNDLTLFHQPIRALIGSNGYTTTLNNLMFRALTQSDNTANDFLLRRAGGPDGVREFLQRKGISGIRFGPGERLMQSRLAGLEWRPEFSIGNAFYAARSSLPLSVRQSAFNRYVTDPVDGATPVGIVEALARLQSGDLLSPSSTRRMLSTMSQTRTGRMRLSGGVPAGWNIAHKTGTGQVLGSVQTGYNDIGVVTAPDGTAYAVAVMIRRTSAPLPQRMQLMQDTVRAVADYHRNRQSFGVANR